MANSQRDFTISSVAELQSIVSHLKLLLSGRDIVLLSGAMGVGKTEFVRALVATFQGENITSPSFAIHNNYSAGALSIDHLDLFRIEGADDLESTGFWDLFDQSSGLIVLEWSEKIDSNSLPRNWKKIKINFAFSNEANKDANKVGSKADIRKISVVEI